MLCILIALLRACIHFLKVIERWSYRNRVDRATQTDVSMTLMEVNIPGAFPIPAAPPPPVERPTNPTPTMIGKVKTKATAKAIAELANKPCWLPNCPKCEAIMTFKKAHHGGYFFGCSTYPKCKGSRPPCKEFKDAKAGNKEE